MKKYLFILLILLVPISVFANDDIKLNTIEVEENYQVFEKNPAFLEEFYNYYKNNTNYIHDYDDLTFNYKGQLIEGENALYRFIGALCGVDLTNFQNIKDDLAAYILENRESFGFDA